MVAVGNPFHYATLRPSRSKDEVSLATWSAVIDVQKK